jgi:hypothetical protein
MPGSGTMARVIKGPEEASQLPWHSIRRPLANCPTHPRRSRVSPTPCLEKTNHSCRMYAVHLIMAREPCERATDWAPVAQLPMYAKKSSLPPHLPKHRDAKHHNNYLARPLVFPRRAYSLD